MSTKSYTDPSFISQYIFSVVFLIHPDLKVPPWHEEGSHRQRPPNVIRFPVVTGRCCVLWRNPDHPPVEGMDSYVKWPSHFCFCCYWRGASRCRSISCVCTTIDFCGAIIFRKDKHKYLGFITRRVNKMFFNWGVYKAELNEALHWPNTYLSGNTAFLNDVQGQQDFHRTLQTVQDSLCL